ncbi:hypothetical protein [Natronosalvus vescus]|uniref:hypothetical protein n=1 Tax=Natronosalvus vescus TaxID=2953881 RepID=UPI002090A10D|nr:hypothetical protein [Natronosalvus vescus]
MELTPEEYGAYWQASARIAVGVLVLVVGYWFTAPFLGYSDLGARALGFVLFIGLVFVGCFVLTLGLARLIRTAVAAERRQ